MLKLNPAPGAQTNYEESISFLQHSSLLTSPKKPSTAFVRKQRQLYKPHCRTKALTNRTLQKESE